MPARYRVYSAYKKKKRGPNTQAPQCHSELIGTVLVVFGVHRLELRNLASNKLEGPFREMLLKSRPPDLGRQEEKHSGRGNRVCNGPGVAGDHCVFPSVFPEHLLLSLGLLKFGADLFIWRDPGVCLPKLPRVYSWTEGPCSAGAKES